MIQVARGKAQALSCDGQIEFHCLDMEQLGPGLDGRLFDGVLSNFGAVNCVRALPALVADVAGRLRPGGTLLWVIMGRRVPWEWMWYLVRGNWRKAARRFEKEGVAWRGMTISYPTPMQVTLELQPYFQINRVAPLGFALPPSYAAGWLNRFPRALRALNGVEWWAQRSSRLASWSDHYIVEATRAG
jgi:SAM-dependent methyltransferase